MGKRWTQEEDDIVLANYEQGGLREVQILLPHRSSSAIFNRASTFGLKAPRRGPMPKTNEQYDQELLALDKCFERLEDYKTCYTPILHRCINDHEWKTTPRSLLSGQGCPLCAKKGFHFGKPAILYYIKISSFNETYYKIGITSQSLELRYSKDTDKDIELIWQKKYEVGRDAFDEEKRLLATVPIAKKKQITSFLDSGGNSELFEEDLFSDYPTTN